MIPDLSQVPKHQRALLLLKYWEDMSDSMIGRYLGLSRRAMARQVADAMLDVVIRHDGPADDMPSRDPAVPVQERVARILHHVGYSQRQIAKVLRVKRPRVAAWLVKVAVPNRQS
jgi:DNA-directed RNA polymerase specialized sigma24 family protein